MKNMKRILKEWRTFLKESNTGTGERLDKYLVSLQQSGMKMSEYKKVLASKQIISALKGFKDKMNFIKNNKKSVMPVLDELIQLAQKGSGKTRYFNLYLTGAQKDKSGSVSAVLEMADFPDFRVSFDDLETLTQFSTTLKNMINNDDYDFDIFTPATELLDEKPRSHGMGTGGVQMPPNLSTKEKQQFYDMASPYFKAAGQVLRILDRSDKMTVKEWYNILLDEARQRLIFFTYLESKWREKTGGGSYFSESLIYNYAMSAASAEDRIRYLQGVISDIQPSAEETVEDLMAKARAGDIEECFYLLKEPKKLAKCECYRGNFGFTLLKINYRRIT